MSLTPGILDKSSSKWTSSDPWSEMKHAPGAYPPSPNPQVEHDMAEQPSIATAVKARRHEYIRKRTVKLKVGSWNVASMSATSKDLAGWFVQGRGVKGLSNTLSELSLEQSDTENDSSSDDNIESVEDQEARAKKNQSTLPKHDEAAVASEDDIGLYVLGLQEVVDITSVTEALRPYYDSNATRKWKRALKKALPAGYKKVAEMQLLGLVILVYAAPEVAADITSVDTQSVGTGALGYVGNKGAVSVRIMLGGTTRMVFVNCHLAAGADQAALGRRIWDTNQILSRTKFLPANYDGDIIEGLQEEIGDEDFAFWFGDLNYRLDGIPGEDVRRLLLLHTRNEYDVLNKSRRRIDSELGYVEALSTDNLPAEMDQHHEFSDIERPASDSAAQPPLDPQDDPASLLTTIRSLLVHDQLRAQQKLGKAFHEGWREGEINFLPTYKYDVGSVGMFDSGEKRRSPSWCDRILFRTRRDKVAFNDRIQRETEARKRDEEMKSRGIDQAAADQEILFDYNPATDGADEYDEYDDAEEDTHETQSVKTVEGADDAIKLEDYVSHQRVLSSDHKPLSAVFTLTYDAVISELKTKVHQEVTRSFDKTENEHRPSLTVVVETPPNDTTCADKSTGASELNAVKFCPVRFGVPQTRAVTIANTSPIRTTFAFIDRPTETGQQGNLAPTWLTIHVNCEQETGIASDQHLGSATRFALDPGEVTTIDLTVMVEEYELVHALNSDIITLDEILVLRILNGRDHFLRIHGSWLPTCFSRTLDELVRVPSGVRNARREAEASHEQNLSRTSSMYHSAPQELFVLTEAIPAALERAVADWTILHADHDAPWKRDPAWPFVEATGHSPAEVKADERMASIREALDTASSIDDHLDSIVLPLERVELLARTLLSFLQSLRDGIMPTSVWDKIEERLIEFEKSTTTIEHSHIQDMAMDVLSAAPVHSVSFTFVTFMLTRIITELTSEPTEAIISPQSPQSPQSPKSPSRIGWLSRASLTLSRDGETASVQSNDSADASQSPRSKFGFLTSIPRRGTGLLLSASSGSTTPTTPAAGAQTSSDKRKMLYASSYAEKLAPVLIRSSRDTAIKGKEFRALEIRKRRVLEAFLQLHSM